MCTSLPSGFPPPLASPVFKYEIEPERQVCKSCTSCECIQFKVDRLQIIVVAKKIYLRVPISFLAEMFGYVLDST